MAARDAGVREGAGVWVGDGGFILSAPCAECLERSMNVGEWSRNRFLYTERQRTR
jgi:hypothetical protein